jgi:signal transduction histidine kinase
MLRNKLLRNLLILSLVIAVLFPGYEYLFVHPAYNDLLAEETESEAVRYASYIVQALGLENQSLTRHSLPEGLEKQLHPASRDTRLIKLRIFSAQGEIIFSTEQGEIGSLNKNEYFRNIVATGRVYSKIVRKDSRTAEGDVAQLDIVETYVPFMAGGAFGGAVEIYSDVTASVIRVKRLSLHSMLTTLLMSCGFLLAIYLALWRAQMSLLARDKANEALRVANQELEQRVAERTRELSDANEEMTRQITERSEAQKALAQALEEIKIDREKLAGILSSVPDGVIVTDGELHVLHMNAAAESILNMPLHEVLGQSIDKLSQEVDFLKIVSQEPSIPLGSSSFDFELLGAGNQPSRIFQGRISQFVSQHTKAPGMVLLIRDVTRDREIERMKNAFLGMAAHELNTPLTTIIGYSELLTEKETSGNFDTLQQKEYLQLIHNKALALGGLIDDLLDVSRFESGRPLTLRYQQFSFDDLLRELAAVFREKYYHHLFELTLPDGAAHICADRSRLEQVVDHLLSNAVKYSPEGGSVRISLVEHDATYELDVSDEGIGMSEEQLGHIFDRFYRADSSDTAVQGVGLGMSIVRHIVLAHLGDIRVESQPGTGTKVRVFLPMTPPAEQGDGSLPFSFTD